jgi:hypothetical protein
MNNDIQHQFDEAIIAMQVDLTLFEWEANPIDFGEFTFQQFVENYNNILILRVSPVQSDNELYVKLYTAKWLEWFQTLANSYQKLFTLPDEDDDNDEPKEKYNPNWLTAMGVVFEHTGINFDAQWKLTVTDWYCYFDYAMEMIRQKTAQMNKIRSKR